MEQKKHTGPPKPAGPNTIDLRGDNKPRATSELTQKKPTQKTQTQTTPPRPTKAKRHWKKSLVLFISIGLVFGGLYILFILLVPVVSKPSEKSIRQKADNVDNSRNQVFIPSVGIQSEVKEGGIDILDQGVVWHRLPERGNPEKGGNFILTGHSFVWGYTPQEVTKQSVFYHLADSKEGDEIIVHWNGKKYSYTVKQKQTVKPNATEVEKVSDKPILTIYTCTTGGASDGRVVIVAEPK